MSQRLACVVRTTPVGLTIEHFWSQRAGVEFLKVGYRQLNPGSWDGEAGVGSQYKEQGFLIIDRRR